MGKATLGTGAYSIALVNRARKTGARIKSSRGKAMEPRLMHRGDIADWVGEGSYNAEKRIVTDPRTLNPFRSGSYGAAVGALLSCLPASECKNMVGHVAQSGVSIREWSGKTDKEVDGIVASKWADQDELFAIALDDNTKLRAKLRNRHSPRPGVKKVNRVTDPATKFGNNIKTLQRVTGATPYGMPLAQCRMCIDSRWVEKNGYHVEEFRIVVGREIPQKQDYRDFRKAVNTPVKTKKVVKVEKAVKTVVKNEDAQLVSAGS